MTLQILLEPHTKGKSTGYHADISITSFYGSHIMNCAGNGGMVCFNNKKHYLKAKLLRSWGRSSSLYDEKSEKIENRFNIYLDGIQYDKKFVFSEIGHNLEPSEMGAAFGLEQLKKLKKNISLRQKNFQSLTNFLKEYENYFILPKQLKGSKTGWLAYPLTIKDKAPFTRTEMQIFLEKKNIQTRVVFTGNILRQPGFKNIKCKKLKGGYPEADKVMKNGILIGCHQGMTNKMMRHLQSSIKKFILRKKNYLINFDFISKYSLGLSKEKIYFLSRCVIICFFFDIFLRKLIQDLFFFISLIKTFLNTK